MKVVGIGGGHGLAATLRAARLVADKVAAVVTVADDGGSSGRLTRELGIPPPGDIRNCLVALATNESLAEVYQHRFSSGLLTGHTVGNLLIAGLAERSGDFGAAVREAGRLLGAVGDVYPATTELVRLGALVEGGVVEGQVEVARTERPIEAVFLEPAAPAAYPPAVQAIADADLIVLGPGSLYTSLMATLLVPGITEAVRETRARRVFVCNSRMQKGETEGLDAADHIEVVRERLGPDRVDVAIVQSPVLPGDGVPVDPDRVARSSTRIVQADVAHADGGHDAERLAEVLAGTAQ